MRPWAVQRVLFAILAGVLLAGALPARGQEFLKKKADDWVEELKSKDAAVRRSAAFALGKMGLPVAWATPELLAALADDKPAVREAAAFALGEIGPTDNSRPSREALLARLKDDNAKVRRSAAFALGRLGARGATVAVVNEGASVNVAAILKDNATAAAPALREALTDRDAIVRQSAAFALGELFIPPDDKTIQGLSSLLGTDDDVNVRRDAAIALRRMGRAAHKALPALVARFRTDEAPVVRRAALDALVEIVTKEDGNIANDLRAALKSKDEDMVRNAAFGLATIGGPTAVEAVPILRKLISPDEELAVRRKAYTALGNIGEQALEARRDFIIGLKEEDAVIRRSCAIGLGRMGVNAKDAIPALLAVMDEKEKNEPVRMFAAEAIASIAPDDRRVLPATLRVLAEHNNYLVRHRAIWILERLQVFDQPGVVEALEGILIESGAKAKLLRYEGAKVLALRMGPKSPERTLKVLLEALQDEKVFIYGGTFAQISATGEGDAGTADVRSTGQGDWRRVAALVLKQIGKERAGTPEILEALKNVSKTSPDPDARRLAAEAYRELGGKD